MGARSFVDAPPPTRRFDTKAIAEARTRRIESEMDRGTFVGRTEAEHNTFDDLAQRYTQEASPHRKKGEG
jgi:hypothetical protein